MAAVNSQRGSWGSNKWRGNPNQNECNWHFTVRTKGWKCMARVQLLMYYVL